MIRFFCRFILMFSLFSVGVILSAQFQPTPVEKSEQKILFQGKTYYVHSVKQGQTLYSICKVYGVSQQDIAAANQGVTLNPLSVGQTLRIPVQKEEKAVSQPSAENKPQGVKDSEDESFYYHSIQPKENVYFLHQKYNVPLDAIYKYNPEAKEGVSIGQVIRIPKKNLVAAVTEPAQHGETVKRYVVQRGDTLYRIAETYGLTVSDLINANQELRWGFKPGQVIQIPEAGNIKSGNIFPLTDSVVDVNILHILSPSACDSISNMKRVHPTVKIAILLPFYAQENFMEDTISLADTISENWSRNDRILFKGRAAVELYEGFLLAVDTLKQQLNTNITLNVFDTESDTNKVKKILKDLEIIEPDLIFGPIAADNIALVSKFAFEHKIPFVPPISPIDTTRGYNPYLIQTIPPHSEELLEYTHYISRFYDDNIILVTKPGVQYFNENRKFKQMLQDQVKSLYGIDSLSIREVAINDDVKKSLNNVLKKDKNNVVIVLSSYEPDVINVLSHLHFKLRDDFSIRVFGLPQWQRFENVRIEVMHELQVTLYSPFFIDYKNPLVKSFILTCRSRLRYEPFKTTSKGSGINYTFLGYDLGFHFIKALNNYQENFCDCLSCQESQLLLSNYHYTFDSSLGCYVNKHITIVRYNKMYELEILK
jgi:LysM repeat protein